MIAIISYINQDIMDQEGETPLLLHLGDVA